MEQHEYNWIQELSTIGSNSYHQSIIGDSSNSSMMSSHRILGALGGSAINDVDNLWISLIISTR